MKEPKLKTVYVCSNCGETSPRWMARSVGSLRPGLLPVRGVGGLRPSLLLGLIRFSFHSSYPPGG